MKRSIPLAWLALILASPAPAQDSGLTDASGALLPFTPPSGRIVVSERSDFSKYANGAYLGHVYREARLELERESLPDGSARYRGEALVLEETMHDLRSAARRIDGAVPVEFVQPVSGALRFTEDNGYPILRGVPASPPAAARVGARWMAEASVVVRPDPAAPATHIPVLVEYEFLGASTWEGRPALAIRGRYAIRYRGGDRAGDPSMTGASGTRTADILIDPVDGSTLFIRESVDETFTYAGGRSIRLKGFILHFHKGSLPGDRDAVATLLGGTAGTGSPAATGSMPSGAAPGGAAQGSPTAGGSASVGVTTAPGTTTPGTTTPGTTAGQPPGTATVPGPAGSSPGPAAPYELARSDRGVVLLLYDLRFEADSDRLLPGEASRLDAIAAALARIPDRSFLVEGHAADLGKPAGQYQLSEARAKRIVDELVARGLPAPRFRWRGLGADSPIAPNDTEQGRARNRRVEITVLD